MRGISTCGKNGDSMEGDFMKKKRLLDSFEPRLVLRHFEDICSIPHGTGYEAALRGHICALAQKNGLVPEQDRAGNLLIRVPAAQGCEAAPPLLIQGHMDMVLAKEPWVTLDLTREPVDLVLEKTDTGNILRASGTTLGADNAVGLCHMMALMDLAGARRRQQKGSVPSDALPALRHPPLELLFTVEEEDGLTGIRKADLSRIRSRRMLNMDCGDPDCVVIGAAGGSKYDISGSFPLSPADPAGMAVLSIWIRGLRGGHSGIEAGKNRASSLELTGRLLSSLCDALPVRLLSLESPPATGGFPHWAGISLVLPARDLQTAGDILARQDQAFHRELADTEPEYRMEVRTGSASGDGPPQPVAASAAGTRALADFLLLVPFDALHRAPDRPDRVLCSALLAGVSFQGGSFHGTFSIRANRDSYREAVHDRLQSLCRLTGLTAVLRSAPTPAWIEREDSPLLAVCLETFHDLTGEDMRVQVENGSVEVSVITAAIPGMDAIGFAPRSRGAHTTQEHLYLDSMPFFWRLFTELLSRLSDG